jgi:hypothetical protein
LCRTVCTVEEAAYLRVEVAQSVRLKPISQDAKHEMTGQVRGCLPPEDRMPSGSELRKIETAQPRGLDVELL